VIIAKLVIRLEVASHRPMAIAPAISIPYTLVVVLAVPVMVVVLCAVRTRRLRVVRRVVVRLRQRIREYGGSIHSRPVRMRKNVKIRGRERRRVVRRGRWRSRVEVL
jgi:hypothetical protein